MTTPSPGRPAGREARAFLVALVDTLDGGFDVDEFLAGFVAGSVALLDVTAAALLLTDQSGALRPVACSGEPASLLSGVELAHGEGPTVECHRTGLPGSYPTISALAARWPDLAGTADRAGITGLHTLPLRRRDNAVGVFTLLDGEYHHIDDVDTLQLAQSLADAATIGLMNQRTIRRHERTSAQLQTALTSRIVIEQAKGMLAGRLGITVDAAFAILRSHARAHNRNLHKLAEDVINNGSLEVVAGSADLTVLPS